MSIFNERMEKLLLMHDEKIKPFVNRHLTADFDTLINIMDNTKNSMERQAAKYLLVLKYSKDSRFKDVEWAIYQNQISCKKYRIEKEQSKTAPIKQVQVPYYPLEIELYDDDDENISKANELWRINKPNAAITLYDLTITNSLKSIKYNEHQSVRDIYISATNKIKLLEQWIRIDNQQRERFLNIIEETYKKVSEIFEECHHSYYRYYLWCRDFADFYNEKINDTEKAKVYWNKSLNIIEKEISKSGTIDATDYGNKGYVLYKLDRKVEALEAYEIAYEFTTSPEQEEIFANWIRNLR